MSHRKILDMSYNMLLPAIGPIIQMASVLPLHVLNQVPESLEHILLSAPPTSHQGPNWSSYGKLQEYHPLLMLSPLYLLKVVIPLFSFSWTHPYIPC